MHINKVSEELKAPEWIDANGIEKHISIPEVEMMEVDMLRIASMKSELAETDIVEEREHIEKCASNGAFYHYNKNWESSVVAELKEYAVVCGMDLSKFKSIEPDEHKVIQKAAGSKITRMASVTVAKTSGIDLEALKEALADPFKIDTAGDMSHMTKSNWEVNKKAEMLEETERIAPIKGNVIAVRGGENTDVAFNPKSGNSKNTIANPKAIEQYAEGTLEDTGARLKKEKAQKEEKKKINHKTWQTDKIAAMDKANILPKGKVFVTESMNAQPGLNTNTKKMGVYSDFDPKNLPERTDGEQLRDKKEASRKSIQREDKKTNEWEVMSKSQYRSLSDDFSSELDKILAKQKGK